jgi:hypothetical protein
VKFALQTTIVLSLVVSGFAAYGLASRVLGYMADGAFGPLLRAPQEPTMHKELTLWVVYFSISFVVTVWLFVVYRKNKSKLWKSN